jgi:large subunit ribosomal protein L18
MPVRNNLSHKQKIKYRIRKKVFGTPECPRLSVTRSLNNIYAQLIDDTNRKTILTVSSLNQDLTQTVRETKTKVLKSKIVGQALAKKAIEMNISKVVFDRNGYLYHGRVKAVADGAREAGLKF